MTHATIYPGADRTTQWRGPGGVAMPSINKLLLHTTESSGWPAYPNFEPTLTFHPFVARGKRWRQHHPVNGSASTLANAGAHRTNRDNVVQIEIVAYCDPAHKTSSAYYTKISEDAYADLAEFYAWLNKEWGTPIKNGLKWKEYPSSYGIHNGVRLTVPAFVAYEGLCGHQHAPEQSHGDPSLLNVGMIIDKAKALAGGTDPVVYPVPKTNDVYLSKLVFGQQNSDSVWQLQTALNKLGSTFTLNGDYGKTVAEHVAKAIFKAAGMNVRVHNDL